MKLEMNPWSVLFLFLCTLCIFPGLAEAQQFQQRVQILDARAIDDSRIEQMRRQYMSQLDSAKLAAESRLEIRVGELKLACELTEEQLRKLSVAAKGAVKSHVGEMKKRFETICKQRGFELEPEESDESNDSEGSEDGANEAANIMTAVIGRVVTSASRHSTIENEKLWSSSIAKVLSDEQEAKWDKWLSARSQFQREAAVGNFVAKVDQALLLSPEQRSALVTAIDKEYGEVLHQRVNTGFQSGIFEVQRLGQIRIVDQIVQPNPNENQDENDFGSEILTETQLKVWKETFLPQLQTPIRNANRLPLPAVRIRPAVAAAAAVQTDEGPVADESVADESK